MASNAIYGDIGETFDAQQVKPQGLYERGRQAAIGEPIDIPYVSTDFTGSGSIVWTVKPGQLSTPSYSLSGMQMTLTLKIIGFSVSGTGTQLRYKVPAGYTIARDGGCGTAFLSDNGVNVQGGVMWAADTTYLSIIRYDNANYTASTNQSSVILTATFFVKSQAI